MSTNLLVVFLLMVVYSDALTNLKQIQQPMPGIKVPKILGQWFAAFRKPPYSWASSRGFVNLSPFYKFEGKNTISIRITWGADFCHKVFGKMSMTPTPGDFLLKDGFGDRLSSRMVAIGTDYKGFLIYWGCTKFSVFGDKCDDPYVVVLTRVPKPSLQTISRINSVLMHRFGFTVNVLDHVLHTGACYAGSKMPRHFN